MKSQPQLYVRQTETDPWTLLDLFESEPLKMVLRVQDVTNPTVASSTYSQTFRVPHSNINGKFFKQVFNVNQTVFDPGKKAYAYINQNGLFFANGNIQLMNIFFNENDQRIEYEITFLAETADFASQIGINSGGSGQGFLTDLNLSYLNHQLNYQNVTDSWKPNGFKNGDIVYPLVEWGYGYTGSGRNVTPDMPTISIGAPTSFTEPTSPLRLAQLKPAIRVKAIWDAIFANTGYTYESEFLNNKDEFQQLYVVSDQLARPEFTTDQSIGWKASASNYSYNYNIATQLYLQNEYYDYGSNFDLSTGVFTFTALGQFEFIFSGNYTFDGPPPSVESQLVLILRDADTNAILTSNAFFMPNGVKNGPFSVPLYFNNTIGTNVKGRFFVNPVVNDPFIPPYETIGYQIYLDSYNIQTVETPAVVQPASCLPNNIKQIDFMRSLIERFKLVFEPSKIKAKHFIITPWSDWISTGGVLDWTSKLNGSVDNKLTPLFQTQQRFVTFKDQDDSDYLNYNYQQAWKQNYGQLNKDSGIEVIKGLKEIQGIFAPLPLGPIGFEIQSSSPPGIEVQANKFLIPHIAKDVVTNEGPGRREPIQPKIRIAWWNGLCGVTGPNSNSSATWYLENGTGYTAQTQIPLMSAYLPHPWSTSAKLLDWNTPLEFNWILPTAPIIGPTYSTNPPGYTDNTAFKLYWKKWYDSCYGETDPKKRINPITGQVDKDYSYLYDGEFILNYQDVWGLRLNDLIFVKDAYYLINSIEANFSNLQSPSKVQLFKLNNLGIALPNTFYPITDFCYSADNACDAVCCYFVSPITTLYCTNQGELVVGDRLTLDIRGQIAAPNGYYKKGDNVYTITNGSGNIDSIDTTSSYECTCIPELFSLEVCYSDSEVYCEACCCVGTNETIWVPDTSSAWYLNPVFWGDVDGNTFVPDGYYSDGTHFVQVAGGFPQQTGTCDCNCDIYNLTPYEVCYGSTKCDAVCCTNNSTARIYGDFPAFEDCEELYSDQSLTPVSAGWYSNGYYVLNVVVGGAVVAVETLDSCLPCENETLDVYFDFRSAVNGPGTFEIKKSFTDTYYVHSSTKELIDIPANTTFSYTGSVAPGTYVRGILNYSLPHDTGTFQTKLEIDGSIINSQDTVKDVEFSYTPVLPSVTDREYRFSVNLTGTNLDCSLSGGIATKCIDPTCIIDGSNSVYLVNNPWYACCDPLYISTNGVLSVVSELFEDANCTGPAPGECYLCDSTINGTSASSSYYAYPHYDICDDLATTTVSINWSANDRPNRFSFYNNTGQLSSSGWVGYANYPGPWGSSLSTPSTGNLSAPYTTGLGTYILVEAGPADPSNPINDFWSVSVNCQGITCYDYENISATTWVGDYQDCNGTWYYSATVFPTQSVCAIQGTPFTLSGSDLQQQTQCNV